MKALKKKVCILIFWVVLSLLAGLAIWYFNEKHIGICEAITGALIAIFIEKTWVAGQDITDTTDWKASQRKLLRGGILQKDTLIRISFSYLYRIKVGSEYLLVRNARGTGKYQPVGGVYKIQGDEKTQLNTLFHVVDDDKVPIDESSRDDYRLQIPCRYLRKFVKRFDNEQTQRERINNVSREFYEELGGIVKWENFKYRYCGRHMTELKYGDHFRCYELLLADVVEVLPTDEQLAELEELKKQVSKIYRFATPEEIKGLGVVPRTKQLKEWIADHSMKILQENEQYLMKKPEVGKVFKVTAHLT